MENKGSERYSFDNWQIDFDKLEKATKPEIKKFIENALEIQEWKLIHEYQESLKICLDAEKNRVMQAIGEPPPCLDILIEGKTFEQSQHYIEGAEEMRKMIQERYLHPLITSPSKKEV